MRYAETILSLQLFCKFQIIPNKKHHVLRNATLWNNPVFFACSDLVKKKLSKNKYSHLATIIHIVLDVLTFITRNK